jgi:hypothetical protein
MRNEYTLQFTAACPVDQLPDVYLCVVRAARVVPVEDILRAAAAATKGPAYQEDITQKLHRLLACEVETVGWHSGVLTRCVCGGGA